VGKLRVRLRTTNGKVRRTGVVGLEAGLLLFGGRGSDGVGGGSRGGLPLVQEGEDVFGGHGTSGFEFAAFLAKEELAVGLEDGDGGDAALERNVVFLGDVEIFVHLADVDVDYEEGLVEGGSDFRGVKRFVEDVTIKAPVATEDDQDAFVRSRRGAKGFGDFLIGVDALWINLLIFEGLAKTGGRGVLSADDVPLTVLTSPRLAHGNELPLGRGALLGGEGELDGKLV
jgi:hypothetical protein